MMKRTLSLLVIFISVFYAMAQEKVKKHIEEGVEVIVNPIKPCPIKGEPTTLHLEKEFTIDITRDDLKRTGLKDIWIFDIDSENNIYLTGSPPDAT